mmetsp:Transcript_24732/g.61829  ORF Transcript_24732/g.61829 Transcript_24732/m.61829 type:complete len:98 (-) Transcript_24732:283-576(-)
MSVLLSIVFRNKKLLGNQYEGYMRPLLLSAAINFAFGMTPGSRIDNFGHLGGFLGGLAISFLVGPRYKTVGYDRFGRARLVDEPFYKTLLQKVRERY